MRYVVFSLGLMLSGCATLEQQCENEVSVGHYESIPQCVSFKQEANRQMSQSFQNMGNSMQQRNMSSFSSPQNIDMQCQSQCLAAGYLMGFCNSKCAY